jgi:hypothetical protein
MSILLNPLAIIYHAATIVWPIYVFESIITVDNENKSIKSIKTSKSVKPAKTTKTTTPTKSITTVKPSVKDMHDILIKYWCIYSLLTLIDGILGTYLYILPGYNFVRIFIAWYIIKNDFYNSVVLYDIIKNHILDNNIKQINLSEIIDLIVKTFIEYTNKIMAYACNIKQNK